MKQVIASASLLAIFAATSAQTVDPIRYGNMDNWVTRNIHESAVIGGATKTIYEIAPTTTIDGNKPYVNMGGSPWATSNVYAKVSGVSKTSNAVYPFDRGNGNKAARLATQMEHVKVLGLINMDVMVAGSMFLGKMIEPITSTKHPYTKMEMGVPYTGRPSALVFDYKIDMPATDTRVKSTGFGSKKTLPGHDNAVTFVFLQRRWEDAEGNIHARRVGTAGRLFTKTEPWTNGYRLPINYGDISNTDKFEPYMALRNGDTAYYAKNSKGKMVPVNEEGWDDPTATPTHLIVMFSAGNGEPYIGTEGLTLYIDNVGLQR